MESARAEETEEMATTSRQSKARIARDVIGDERVGFWRDFSHEHGSIGKRRAHLVLISFPPRPMESELELREVWMLIGSRATEGL